MRQRTWMFADDGTGELLPRTFSASTEGDAIANAPPGTIVVEGSFDHASQRLDLSTGEVVDFQPTAPEPADEYEWSIEARRWVIRPDVAERVANIERAQQEIDRLEAGQARAIREAYLNPHDDEARKRINAIDSAIAEQRTIIRVNSS